MNSKRVFGICLFTFITIFSSQITSASDLDFTVNLQHPSCVGLTDGAITISPENGVPAYRVYVFGPGNYFSTSLENSGLAAGDYHVRVEDGEDSVVEKIIRLKHPVAAEIYYLDEFNTICWDEHWLQASEPDKGFGRWSVMSGAGEFSDLFSHEVQISGMAFGSNIYRWTIYSGDCVTYDEVEIINNKYPADAGNDIELCSNSTTLNANIPPEGATGSWSVVEGGVTIPTDERSNPNASISFDVGVNLLKWSITYQGCVSSDEVYVFYNRPYPIDAGPDRVVYESSIQLDASPVTNGSGIWSLISGSASITYPYQYNSQVSNLRDGENIFRWTVTSGSCMGYDEVTIVKGDLIDAHAGPDEMICIDETWLSASDPSPAFGSWSVVSGSAVFEDRNSPYTKVTNLGKGDNTLRWTVTYEDYSSFDDVTITNSSPDIANAGNNIDVYDSSVALGASTPLIGSGSWSLMSGRGDIEDITDPNTIVHNLLPGENVFRWTVVNNFCASYDEVVVTSNIISATIPEGDGTSNSPYLIGTLENLYWLSQNQDKWNAHFLQTDDIDASETSQWNAGEGWEPIGNSLKPFSGVYNGDGKSITGLGINRPESDRQGFFGVAYGAILTNIQLNNMSVIGMNYVGGLVGEVGYGTIENVFVSGDVKGDVFVGLLAGSCYGLNVDRCQSHGVVNGNYDVGGLIGTSSSSELRASFSSASIEAKDYIGGLVGSMYYYSTTENCYATGNVSGTFYIVGGLVGSMDKDCTIKNSYSIGQVLTSSESGGLIGRVPKIEDTFILASFWDIETSGKAESAAGDGLTTSEMNDFQTFISVGWDFKGIEKYEIWNIGNGRNNGYPYLNWQHPNDESPGEDFRPVAVINSVTEITTASVNVNAELLLMGKPVGSEYGICWSTEPSPTVNDFVINKGVVVQEGVFSVDITELANNTNYYIRAFAKNEVGINYSKDFTILTYDIIPQKPEGLGTVENPYFIENLANLLWIGENPDSWNKYFLQTNNIDASSTSGWNNGEGWKPLGRVDKSFRGRFDGNGYFIDGLTINRPEENYQGLFGQSNNSELKNIQLINVDISGGYWVGGLAGRTLSNCLVENNFTTGSIEGSAYVGGLIGQAFRSQLNSCYSLCNVIGGSYVGGLIGICGQGVVSNTYSMGDVEGDRYVGGLIGEMYDKASLQTSYSKGAVKGDKDAGGLIGSFKGLCVSRCFWDMETSGCTVSAAGEGKTTEEMKEFQTFISVGWDFKDSGEHEIWNIGNNKNDGYPYFNWESPDDLPSVEDFRPVVNIVSVEDITSNSALVNVEIILVGKPEDSHFGICWSTEPNPTVDDFILEKGSFGTPGMYSGQIQNLINNTNYYIRAFAENEVGINYSEDLRILTHDITPQNPEGLGTVEDPFLIDNLANLLWVSENPESWSGIYLQTNSIDASSTSEWNNGEGWSPIGVHGNPFKGSYNGNGYCIKGLTIYRPENNYQGLFGYCLAAEFSNILLTDVNITGDFWVGGLDGGSFNNTFIKNCVTSGLVTGFGHVGGLSGGHSGIISGCYSLCNVKGIINTGGLVGTKLGGSVKSSYARGNVEGGNSVGGLIGQMYENTTSVNSYSLGEVAGNSTVGGLVGRNWGSTISGCFWDVDSSKQPESAGGEGKTTQEMKSLSTFVNAGWELQSSDLIGVWSIDAMHNDGYPYLTELHPDEILACFPEYQLSFKVEDFVSNPVLNAIIYIAGEELVTNDLGEVSIWLVSGNYDFVVNSNGFLDVYGKVSIADSNTLEKVVLTSVSTSSKDAIAGKVTVYPIPASDRINVESDETIEFINLLSIDGRQVYQNNVEQQQYTILVGNLYPGVYIVQVKTINQMFVKQIVIKR